MKIASYSNVAQFASFPTQLDHLLEDFVMGLDEIAVAISAIGQAAVDLVEEGHPIKSVSSRLLAQSSKFTDIMARIEIVKSLSKDVKDSIDRGELMFLDSYEDSLSRVNSSSRSIEEEINRARHAISRGETYKIAYYQETQVIIEYAGLVRKFNECVEFYRRIHHITNASFKDADISLSFFRLKADVSNLPSVNQAPENSDVNRGYKK